jgi:cytidine deaminase
MSKSPEKLTISTEFDVFSTEEFLPEADRKLLQAARQACKNAYAPYSRFQVGAAVLLDNSEIISGNNQENAAYPSGLCAERVALFYASSKHPASIVKAIAIFCHTSEAIAPCGACRQSIAEYEVKNNSPVRVIMSGASGKVLIAKSIESLLPLMFNSKHLK